MKIIIGADHVGYEHKEAIKKYLIDLEYIVEDMGPFSYNEDDDYPDFVKKVADAVADNLNTESDLNMGIYLSGSGQGEAMCANRISGVRASVFYGQVLPIDVVDIQGEHSNDSFEIIKLSREHNDANFLSIGTRFVSLDEAKFAIELFLKTEFSKEERHIRRIKKFN